MMPMTSHDMTDTERRQLYKKTDKGRCMNVGAKKKKKEKKLIWSFPSIPFEKDPKIGFLDKMR